MAHLPVFAVCIALLGLTILAGFVYTNLCFLFLRKLGDGARYSIGYIKTSWVLFQAYSLLWAVQIIFAYTHGDFDVGNLAEAEITAINGIFEPLGLSIILLTQLEMALGFRYASGLTAHTNDVILPRKVARISFVVGALVTILRFVAMQYYIIADQEGAAAAVKGLHIVLWFVLLAQAVACAVYISIWCRPSKLIAVRNMLLAMSSISVARHLFEFIVSVIVTAQGETRALTNAFDHLLVLTVLLRPVTAFVSCVLAYTIARREENGLWGDRDGMYGRRDVEMNRTAGPLPPRRI